MSYDSFSVHVLSRYCLSIHPSMHSNHLYLQCFKKKKKENAPIHAMPLRETREKRREKKGRRTIWYDIV